MKLRPFLILLGFLTGASALFAEQRDITSFDAGWRFFKGDTPGAESSSYDDSKWRRLDVPHDWSIEGPFAATNSTGAGGAFLPSGVGWYRKHFALPEKYGGRRSSQTRLLSIGIRMKKPWKPIAIVERLNCCLTADR